MGPCAPSASSIGPFYRAANAGSQISSWQHGTLGPEHLARNTWPGTLGPERLARDAWPGTLDLRHLALTSPDTLSSVTLGRHSQKDRTPAHREVAIASAT